MSYSMLAVGLALSGTVKAASASPFTSQLSSDDFSSAGLSKLTPAERARLDALVKAYESGELARARAAAAAAQAGAERAANQATVAPSSLTPTQPPEKSGAGWLRRITLNPGTKVEYETVETELVGPFSGWHPGTVFTLNNGQRWKVVTGEYPCPPDPRPHRVKISPGMLGSFFLQIEGIRPRAKVTFVGTTD